MKREQKKLENAFKHLEKIYNNACENDNVNKPLSYALYHTWKYYNCYEVSRKKDINK